MLKFTITICVFSIVIIFIFSTVGLALVMVDKGGHWPESWPKELEPYRKQAETFQVAEGNQLNIYEIRFRDREDFEQIWPTILRLKSKGAPIRLVSCSDASRDATSMGLFDNKVPAVRILAPPFNTDVVMSLGITSGTESEWPSSVKLPTDELPEYIVNAEDGSWVPEQEVHQAVSFKYRVRIDIELVIDGKIIDLSRIRLPANIPIVDKRKLPYEKMETIDIESLVEQIGTATLSRSAEEMVSHRLLIAAEITSGNIDPELWTKEIQRLKPIRMYGHRMNIVVVLSENYEAEGGVYICIPISSYFPRDGDDGFTFEHLGDGVYRYRRELQSEPPEHFEGVIVNGYPVKGASNSSSEVIPSHLNENLIMYCSFHTDVGQKTVTDISGKGYHGQVHGAEYAKDNILGGIMSFDGDEDYISVPNVYLREFTFSAWLKAATDDLNNRRIFLLSDGEHCYALQGNTGEGVGVYVADSVELNEYDWRFAKGTWTHISVTHDGHNLSIYRNGRLTEAGNIKTSGVKGTLYIGGTDLHRGGFWYGAIDEVALFNRALTVEEIVQLYNMTGTTIGTE
jgi:hypothetical protein